MDFLSVVIFIILGIGAIVAVAIGLIVLYYWWWIIIPLACACIGGVIGFIFGLGLDVIIGLIILGISSSKEEK